MFEEQQEEDKQSSRRGTIVLITIVLVLLIVGGIVYADSKGMFSSSSSSTPAKAAAVVTNADPAKDLHIISTKIGKDSSGLTAVWLVDVKNESSTNTYSHIKYETTYGGAGDAVLGQNKGEIPSLSLGPGEEQSVQFNDAAYPDGLAWYRVKITGATATQ